MTASVLGGGGFAPPAGTIPGMDATKMRALSNSNPDWKKKQQEAKKKGTPCAVCKRTVGSPGVDSLTVEHMFPADRIWTLTKDTQTVNQIRRHFTNPQNLMLMCKSCNSSKGGKTYRQWAQDSPSLISPAEAAKFQATANAFQQSLLGLR
jgi:5-methylcytosine-specific restriction endonuclease McrA